MPTNTNARLCLQPSASTKGLAQGKPQVKVLVLSAPLVLLSSASLSTNPHCIETTREGLKERVSKGITH